MALPYNIPSIRGDDAIQTYQLQSALMRQRQASTKGQLAKALMQQGASTAPVDHWLQGLARVAQSVAGAYLNKQDEREGKQADEQMLAQMIGDKSQRQASEVAQLAQAGVPGFQMPMPNPVPGQAREVPTAPAGGGAEVVPANMLQPVPQPAARPVDSSLVAALMRMSAEGNQTAARAAPAFQFQYQDQQLREREARQEAAAAAREARMSRESFGAPTVLTGPDGKPQLVMIGNQGTVRPVQGGYQPPPQERPAPFDGKAIEGQALNILLDPNADPASPIYAAAYARLYGPKTVVDAQGVATTIRPEAPQGIRPPVAGGGGGGEILPQATPGAAPVAGAPPSTTTAVPGGTVTRTGAGKEAALTEAQSKANMFGLAMSEGNRILTELNTAPSSAAIMAWRNLPEGGVNFGLSEKDQRYFNALRQFAAGVLRKETGAAFTPTELLDVQSRFFAMPGDSDAVKQQKARARQQAIEAMKAEVPGGFRGQIAAPEQPLGLAGAQPPPAPVRVNTPDEARRLPSGTPIILPDGTMGRVP